MYFGVAPDILGSVPSRRPVASGSLAGGGTNSPLSQITGLDGERTFASYAYGAIEEAEYAVLDAPLARMDADALAAG